MRKVLFAKWIPAVPNPEFDSTKSQYSTGYKPQSLPGTNCYASELTEVGYFHGFIDDEHGQKSAVIESEGEIKYLYSHLFKFIDSPEEVDWEQRRYELAKAAMRGILSGGEILRTGRKTAESIVDYACKLADEMINQLKKSQA